jgi:hypothetical protein
MTTTAWIFGVLLLVAAAIVVWFVIAFAGSK